MANAPSSPQAGADGNAAAAASKCPPGLYVVATPIGNLGDVSARARRVLAGVDVVACEDTRRTGRLLAACGVSARLAAYHDRNAPRARPGLLARLARGEAVALVSDAGTPAISDPGYRLVDAAHRAGAPVFAVPGPSSVAAAIGVSGLPSDRFAFVGFLPPRGKARRGALASLARLDMTAVVFESARRLAATLADLEAALGDRRIAIAREMTKLHEEVRRGSLRALAAEAAAAPPPKGEIVLVIAPPAEAEAAAVDEDAAEAALADALGAMSARDAARAVAAATGADRRRLYARAAALKRAGRGGAGDGG